MPPRNVKEVRDMEIDEISLVDRPANQHAKVVFAKRAPEEENMPDIYDADSNVVSLDDLKFGDVVYDADGNEYEFVPAGDDEDEDAEAPEYAEVGKSYGEDRERLASQIRDDLSKALRESDDKDALISKALADAEQRIAKAEQIAKSERDLRLTREYISKAAEYNVPIDPTELGPVLYRMAESMSYADCAVIHKALTAAGELIYEEIGYQGGGDNDDVLSMATAAVNEAVSKSANAVSAEAAMAEFFMQNPAAYDAYLAEQR